MADPTTTQQPKSWWRGLVDQGAGLFGYKPEDVDTTISGAKDAIAGSIIRNWGTINGIPGLSGFVNNQLNASIGTENIDLLLALGNKDDNFDQRLAAIQSDPILSKLYADSLPQIEGSIQGTINEKAGDAMRLLEDNRELGEDAKFPLYGMLDEAKKNGAKKIALAVAESVQEAMPKDYSVQYGSSAFMEHLRDKGVWNENGSMLSNVFGTIWYFITNIFNLGEIFDDIKQRGERVGLTDMSNKAEQVANDSAERLIEKEGFPPAIAAQIAGQTYVAIKRKAGDSEFTAMSDSQVSDFVSKYAADHLPALQQFAAAHPRATSPAAGTAGAAAAAPQQGTQAGSPTTPAPAAGAGAIPPVAPLDDAAARAATATPPVAAAPLPPAIPVPRTFAEPAPAPRLEPLDMAKITSEAEKNPEFYASPIFKEKLTAWYGSDYDTMADDAHRMAYIRKNIPDAQFLRDGSGKLIIQAGGQYFYDDKDGTGWRDANKMVGSALGKGLDWFRDTNMPIMPSMDSAEIPGFVALGNEEAGAQILNGLMRMGRADVDNIRSKINVAVLGNISKTLAQGQALAASDELSLQHAGLTANDVSASLGYARPATLELGQVDLTKYGATWKNSLAIAWGFMLSGDDQSRMDIIKENLPQAEFENVEGGGIMVKLGGDKFWLNAPGASLQDTMDISGTAALFTPAGRGASIIGGTLAMGRNIIVRGAIKGTAQAGAALGTAALAQRLSDEVGDKTPEDLGGLAYDALAGSGNAALVGMAAKMGGAVLNKTLGSIVRKTLLRQPLAEGEKAVLGEAKILPEDVVSAYAQRSPAANGSIVLESAPVSPGATLSPGMTPKAAAAAAAGVLALGGSSAVARGED